MHWRIFSKQIDPLVMKKAKTIVSKLFFHALNNSFLIDMYYGEKDKTFKKMQVTNTKNEIKLKKSGLVNYVDIQIDPHIIYINSIFGKVEEKTGGFWSKILLNKGNFDFLQKTINTSCKILSFSDNFIQFQLENYEEIFSVNFDFDGSKISISEIRIEKAGGVVAQIWII